MRYTGKLVVVACTVPSQHAVVDSPKAVYFVIIRRLGVIFDGNSAVQLFSYYTIIFPQKRSRSESTNKPADVAAQGYHTL